MAIAVAIGGELTNIVFQNTSASALGEQVATFGQVFAEGALQATGAAVSLVGDSTVSAQIDVKATHVDGSVRHAIISAAIPALAASTSKTYSIRRVASSAATPAVPADFPGLDSVVTVLHDGTTYSASLATLLAAGKTDWLSGDVASEWRVNGPLKTSGGTAHAGLTVRFNARVYKGKGKARIDVIVENGEVTVGGSTPVKHAVYDLTITVGGAQVYAKTGVVHLPFRRFRKTYWHGGAAPTVHIRHNSAYAIATKALPNYEPALIGATSTTAENVLLANLNLKRDIFQPGLAMPYMGSTGGRLDIGLLPGWDALYILGMNPAMRDVCFTQADLMGGWEAHKRDKATGQAISAIDSSSLAVNPVETIVVTDITNANPAVATTATPHKLVPGMQVSMIDVVGTGTYVISGQTYTYSQHLNYKNYVVGAVTANTLVLTGLDTTGRAYTSGGKLTAVDDNVIDLAHQPAVGFAAYLFSGDHYHLEEMQFYASSLSKNRLLYGRESRAQAWGLRAFGYAAYLSPDSDRLKDHFKQLVELNLTDYIARYTTGAQANPLGILNGGSSWSDPDSTGSVTRTWQDDFFTSSIGRLIELGFTSAAPLFAIKAKYAVQRMNYNRMLAATYSFKVRPDNASPIYSTIAEVYAASYPPNFPSAGNNIMAQVFESAAMAAQAGPTTGETVVANSMINNPSSNIGYVANMQPALAYAATLGATDAAAAWAKYEARAVKQSNYAEAPQFDIVPRSTTANEAPVSTVPLAFTGGAFASVPMGVMFLELPADTTTPPTGGIDISTIPPSRRVVFEGGVRVVEFVGGVRTINFPGGIRKVDF